MKAQRELRPHGNKLFPFDMCLMKIDGPVNAPCIITPMHWHEEAEIIYVEYGEISIFSSGHSEKMTAGEIMFVNPCDIHGIETSTGNVRYYAFVFLEELLASAVRDAIQTDYIEKLLRGDRIIKGEAFRSAEAEAAVKIIVEANTPPKLDMLATKGALYILLSWLHENGYVIKKTHTQAETERDREIISYISDNCAARLTLGELSEKFHMSENYFCRYFKKHFGQTVFEFINYRRIENAAELLRTTERSVTDIAISSGFESMSYFTRKFRQVKCMTPKDYRRCNG